MGLYASYAALSRYDSGQDLYIPPRSQSELFRTLRSYSFDAIHNLISQSRSAMQPGGYSRVRMISPCPVRIAENYPHLQACEIASKSISSVLAVKEHTTHLLELHQRPRTDDVSLQCPVASPSRRLKT